jgi:hypothetical protein
MTDISGQALFHVILDSNIWRSAQLLQRALGSALLHALSAGRADIVLPEIVELELPNIFYREAKAVIESIHTKIVLLEGLPGNLSQGMTFIAPDPSAVRAGVEARWEQLGGLIKRVGFTHDHARGALNRILAKRPPCGQNNEQFRDCCIWEVALEIAQESPVHLITKDTAFYDGRNRLSPLLQEEVSDRGLNINLYPDISDFLSAMKQTVPAFDEGKLASKIVDAVNPLIKEAISRMNAGGRYDFALEGSSTPQIQGFSTPKSNILAVSFKCNFVLRNVLPDTGNATLIVEGSCAYDPQNNDEVFETEIAIWRLRINGLQRSWSGTVWEEPGKLEEMFSK